MTKEYVLALIEDTKQEFISAPGSSTRFIFEDKTYVTDTACAMDGIDFFIERLVKKLEESK